MRLIITRHGQTEENKAGIIQGQIPGKLSQLGIEQAKKVAKRLKTEKIDHIYASDLARASDTGKEIAKYHPEVPFELVKELREKYYGSWQGKELETIKFTDKEAYKHFSPPDAESWEALFKRAEDFLRQVLAQHQDETVVFVGHDGINKAMIAVINGQTAEDIRTIENLYNTSVCIYEIDENKKHEIVCFNCKKHL